MKITTAFRAEDELVRERSQAAAARRRLEKKGREEKGAQGTFPDSFVEGRERAIENLRINQRFTDDLAHTLSRADDSKKAQEFFPNGTKHGSLLTPALGAMSEKQLCEILERTVERHGSGYTFHPHRSIVSGKIEKVVLKDQVAA